MTDGPKPVKEDPIFQLRDDEKIALIQITLDYYDDYTDDYSRINRIKEIMKQ